MQDTSCDASKQLAHKQQEDDSESQIKQQYCNKTTNFLHKFRDQDTKLLKSLNSTQFIEVWNNYDKDGKFLARAMIKLISKKWK